MREEEARRVGEAAHTGRVFRQGDGGAAQPPAAEGRLGVGGGQEGGGVRRRAAEVHAARQPLRVCGRKACGDAEAHRERGQAVHADGGNVAVVTPGQGAHDM